MNYRLSESRAVNHDSSRRRWQWPPKTLFFLLIFFLPFLGKAQDVSVTGSVADSASKPLGGVTVSTDVSKRSVLTDEGGLFTIKTSPKDKNLVFTYVGLKTTTQPLNGSSSYSVTMSTDISGLSEVVVIGYGSRKKESLTGAISTVTSSDIGRVHGGSTASTTLAGKLPGVTFRQGEGRPGSSASIQIRNMGEPLYVIDGIQQDAGQFNNLAPNDIESITVLKDASAAIYGVRAANGVVVVTTKKGTTGRNNVNVDAYNGWQSFFRFPKTLTNTNQFLYYKADAEINKGGTTAITQAQIDDKTAKSFDWRDYVLNNNGAPLNSVNINISGGSDKVNYYVSGTNLYQNSVLGKQYNFNRTNIQSNVTAKLTNGLRVGFDINGRVETRKNPGVPGGDDYTLARLAVLRNTPQERPYANDNPKYLNNLGDHLESNYAFLNTTLSGKFRDDWRVLQTNFHVDWDIPWIKGLSVRGLGSYYMADRLENNQEYTYDAFTYTAATDSTPERYDRTGGATNPWRDREQIKQINTTLQAQANYNNTFGQHTIGATIVAERLENHYTRNWLHASPKSNSLPLVYYNITDQYQDADNTQARVGYIGRISYSYANRYFIDLSARRDASYLFAPDSRVGYFPGGSVGWRVTEEPFIRSLLGNKRNILSDFKIRASYGLLGDDRDPNNAANPIVGAFAYLPGYNYGAGFNNVVYSVLDGNLVSTSRDKGTPITSISWLKSKVTDIGADFSFLNGKITGTFDWFYRKRSGLVGIRSDVVLPIELGYSLASENLNSDARYGEEGSLAYNGAIGKVNFTLGGNLSFSQSKNSDVYNPTYLNSYDKFRTGTEGRYSNLDWGYVATGQFTSQEQINNYDVDIDAQGNRTLLPGDIIYKDINGDKKIDQLDQMPISFGYGQQPKINFGFTIGGSYKQFDFHADFSGAGGYSWFQNWETRWAFQNNGNLNTIFEDRWHRADIYDPNSEWIPGKYPANRYNPGFGHSDYSIRNQDYTASRNSTFWLHNAKYFRARTIELGYSLPKALLQRIKIQRARFYVNAYNLFSIDNLRQYNIDPEVVDDNGIQFPQNKVINVGVNLSF